MSSLKQRQMQTVETKTDPIDEDEQDKLIATVTKDFQRQVDQISNMMSMVCFGAMIATIISSLVHELRFLGKYKRMLQTYPIFSTLINILSMRISKSIKDVVPTFQQKVRPWDFHQVTGIFGMILIIFYVTVFATIEVKDVLIWTLTATNIMILLGSLYIQYDTKQTTKSINELKSYKYKFKSL